MAKDLVLQESSISDEPGNDKPIQKEQILSSDSASSLDTRMIMPLT